MSRAISVQRKQRLLKLANYRCGYCLTSQHVIGPLLEVEHIVPASQGGSDEDENLWIACPSCNNYKADKTSAPDALSGKQVRLFNPRQDVWREHFKWSDDGTQIIGLGDPASFKHEYY